MLVVTRGGSDMRVEQQITLTKDLEVVRGIGLPVVDDAISI